METNDFPLGNHTVKIQSMTPSFTSEPLVLFGCKSVLISRSPSAPSGQRFDRTGLSASSQERMYHSSATLLPDGSILVAGSNPNKDVTQVKWGTSYTVEKFYPAWYSETRPVPTSDWPENLSYGGEMFNVTYQMADNSTNGDSIKVVVIRPGFSTHCVSSPSPPP